jgi:hypothetical protein
MTADLPAHAAAIRSEHGVTARTAVTAGLPRGPAEQIAASPADPAGPRRPGRLRLRWVAPVVAGTLIAGGLVAYALVAGGGNTARAADHHDAASTAAGGRRHHPAASVTPGLDSCLFGTWKGVSDEYTDQINSNTDPVMYGTGPTQIFNADGVTITRYQRSEPDTGHFNGVTWKVAQDGSATATYTATAPMTTAGRVVGLRVTIPSPAALRR